MKEKNIIEIKWGAFAYKGKAEQLPYVMETLFAKMPPDADYSKRVIEEQKDVNNSGGYR